MFAENIYKKKCTLHPTLAMLSLAYALSGEICMFKKNMYVQKMFKKIYSICYIEIYGT